MQAIYGLWISKIEPEQSEGIRNNQQQRDNHCNEKPKGHEIGEQFSPNECQEHCIIA